jgi:predicted transcriptional regulator
MSLTDTLLRLIKSDPGVNQQLLEHRAMKETRLPKSSVIKGLNDLESQGHIQRKNDEGGRKVYPG